MQSKIVSNILEKGLVGASLSEIWEYASHSPKEALYAFLKSCSQLTPIHFARFVHIDFASHWLIPVYDSVDANSKKSPRAYVQPRIWLALNGSFNVAIFDAALAKIYDFIKEHPGVSLVMMGFCIF